MMKRMSLGECVGWTGEGTRYRVLGQITHLLLLTEDHA